MARPRIILFVALVFLLSACQNTETLIHRWDQAAWDNAHWH